MQSDLQLLNSALDCDRDALAQLFARLTPVLHARVACAVRRWAPGRRTGPHEVEDLVQEVFVAILDRNCRALRTWNPERHASLETFVGIVARNRVHSILRSNRKCPRTEQPSSDSIEERSDDRQVDPERTFAGRELFRLICAQLTAELDGRGVTLFEIAIVADRPLAEVCRLTGMSKGAVYTWKCRTMKRAREIAGSLL